MDIDLCHRLTADIDVLNLLRRHILSLSEFKYVLFPINYFKSSCLWSWTESILRWFSQAPHLCPHQDCFPMTDICVMEGMRRLDEGAPLHTGRRFPALQGPLCFLFFLLSMNPCMRQKSGDRCLLRRPHAFHQCSTPPSPGSSCSFAH